MITAGKRIGLILKRMRQEKGYSQSHVASSLSIPVRTYQSWETGYTSNVDNLITLCGFYGITPVDLFSEWLEELPSGGSRPGTMIPEQEKEISSILDRILEGEDLESLAGTFPSVFNRPGETPEDILYRLILDVYFSRPDTLASRFPGYCRDLEQDIAAAYGIPPAAVTVIRTGKFRIQLLREIYLAFPGAGTLTEWASEKPGFRLGVSNGYTVARLLDQIGRGSVRNLSLFPLNFTNTPVDFPISSNSLISSFLYRTEGYGNSMDTPGEMEVYGSMLLADAVVLGAGTFSREGLYEKMIRSTLGNSVMERIREAGVIGDLNYNLLDREGNRIDLPEVVSGIGHPESTSLIKAINLDLLAQKADRGCRVMAAAAGSRKALPVHLALKKGYVNHLLVDQSLAEELLSL